jgi:hypothetical protein
MGQLASYFSDTKVISDNKSDSESNEPTFVFHYSGGTDGKGSITLPYSEITYEMRECINRLRKYGTNINIQAFNSSPAYPYVELKQNGIELPSSVFYDHIVLKRLLLNHPKHELFIVDQLWCRTSKNINIVERLSVNILFCFARDDINRACRDRLIWK